MNITISGDIGSGKSTVAKILSHYVGCDVIEAGTLYREYAAKKGLSVLQQNESDDWEIDKYIDTTMETYGKEQDNIIFVSRLAWHFVPDAYKICLIVNPITAAKRIAADKKRIGEQHSTWGETYEYNKKRKSLENTRYNKMYGINDTSGYDEADLVVVIGNRTPEEIVNAIRYALSTGDRGLLIDPEVILPTQRFRDINPVTYEDYTIDFTAYKGKPYVSLSILLGTYNKNSYSVLDGHHRVIAAVRNKIPFILTEKPLVRLAPIDTVDQYDYEELLHIDLDDIVAESGNKTNDGDMSFAEELTVAMNKYDVSVDDLAEYLKTTRMFIFGILNGTETVNSELKSKILSGIPIIKLMK